MVRYSLLAEAKVAEVFDLVPVLALMLVEAPVAEPGLVREALPSVVDILLASYSYLVLSPVKFHELEAASVLIAPKGRMFTTIRRTTVQVYKPNIEKWIL